VLRVARTPLRSGRKKQSEQEVRDERFRRTPPPEHRFGYLCFDRILLNAVSSARPSSLVS
jgi:hypothetical protein